MRTALAALLALSCAACTRAPADRPTPVAERDSAGITILDHGRLDMAALPRLHLDSAPLLRIGVTDGDEAYQFNRIADATLRADGSIAVLDASRTLRVFDHAGALRWRTGGAGDGPGEFQAPLRVEAIAARCGAPDTLLVWDVRHGRFSLFTEPDGLVRVVSLPALAGRAAWLGLLAGRTALFEQRSVERTMEGTLEAIATRATLLRADTSLSTLSALGEHAQTVQYREGQHPDGAFSPAIFAGIVRFAPGGDGYWLADPDVTALRHVVPGGTHRLVRWRGDDRAVTPADVDAVITKWLAESRSQEQRDAITRYAATHPRASRFPAMDSLLVASDGAVWLSDFVREHQDDGVRRWTRLSADGRAFTHRLEHPASVRLLRVHDDEVLAVERDTLDVEQLVRYRLRPASDAR